jgi:hypothetical protein
VLNSFHNIILSASLPDELGLRYHSITLEIGVAMFVAFLLLSYARLARPNIYAAVSVGMFKVSGLPSYIKESMPLMERASILLLVNYLLSTSIILYLVSADYVDYRPEQLIISVTVPIVLIIGHLGSMRLVGWVTGERGVFRDPQIMKVLGAQVLGIVYFICALIWLLNPAYQDVLVQIVVWSFIVENALRILKSIAIVYAQGVSWYYIILYFCTLEILPLFVVYYFVMQNFID